MSEKYLFVSYAREDAERVLPIVESVAQECRLRDLDVKVWVDVEDLNPGQSWKVEIERVLRSSVGLLAFVSPASVRSAWFTREVTAAAEDSDRLIIPVILEHVPDLPLPLAVRQWLDVSRAKGEKEIRKAAREIVDAIQSRLREARTASPVKSAEAPEIAEELVQHVRSVRHADTGTEQPPDSVFLVHGHDSDALSEVDAYLAEVGVKAFVLSRVGGSDQSLLQKFFRAGAKARFAVVLLSADDLGASREEYEEQGVGDRALQFRARQNVTFELGFFYGLLGWENVFVLFRPPARRHPHFEHPSDIAGAVFDSMDVPGTWRTSLTKKLLEGGFRLTTRGS